MKFFAHSFNYYALRYLLQWEQVERSLHQKFSTNLTTDALRNAMHHFRISRSFSGIDQRKRNLIIKYVNQATAKNPAENVAYLAGKFEKEFGSINLSAASKILWCRDRSPYLILDSRATKALKRLGHRFDAKSYESYENAWQAGYAESEPKINASAKALSTVQPFCTHWHATESSVLRISRERWFKERIFDLSLWENGGDG